MNMGRLRKVCNASAKRMAMCQAGPSARCHRRPPFGSVCATATGETSARSSQCWHRPKAMCPDGCRLLCFPTKTTKGRRSARARFRPGTFFSDAFCAMGFAFLPGSAAKGCLAADRGTRNPGCSPDWTRIDFHRVLSRQAKASAGHRPVPFDYRSISKRRGSSSASFTRTRKVTAPLPSTMRWS